MKIKKILMLVILIVLALNIKVFASEEILTETVEITNENRYELYTKAQECLKNLGNVPATINNDLAEKYILQEIENHNPSINVEDYDYQKDDLEIFWSKLILDPAQFCINSYSCRYYTTGEVIEIKFNYILTKEEHDKCWNEINKVVADYLSQIDSKMTTFDKILFTHNYLCQLADYVITSSEEELNNIATSYHTMASALSSINDYYTVCDGYTEAYQYLLSKVGVNSVKVVSVPMNHAWNLVEYEGNWYHVDVTWDDTDWAGEVIYNYFMKSDTNILDQYPSHHSWGSPEYVCSDTRFDDGDYVWIDRDGSYPVYKNGAWYVQNLERTRYGIYYDEEEFEVWKYDDITTNTHETITVKSPEKLTTLYRFGFTSDGKKLYFAAKNKIMTMNFDGSNIEELCTLDNVSEVTYMEYFNGKIYYIDSSKYYSSDDYVEYVLEVKQEEKTYTTLPVTEAGNDEVIEFNEKSDLKGNIISDNFPVLSSNYTVVVLDQKGSEKTSGMIGSKNKIQIKNEKGEVEKEYVVVVRGDTDGDGRARIIDSFDMLRDTISSSSFNAIDTLISDYNKDGKVRILDAFNYLRDAIK